MAMDTEPKKNKGRGRRILLIASLGLNILIFCLVIGAAIGFHRHDGGSHKVMTDGPGAVYIRALEFDDKRALGKEIRRAYREAGSDRSGDRALLNQMVEVLRTEPFDADAMREVRATLDGKIQKRRQAAFDVWVGYVGNMSADQRAAYADRMVEVMERGRDKYKHKPSYKD